MEGEWGRRVKLTSQNRGRGARAVAVRAVPRSDEGATAVSRGGEIGERGGGGGGGSWFAQVRGARRGCVVETKTDTFISRSNSS